MDSIPLVLITTDGAAKTYNMTGGKDAFAKHVGDTLELKIGEKIKCKFRGMATTVRKQCGGHYHSVP